MHPVATIIAALEKSQLNYVEGPRSNETIYAKELMAAENNTVPRQFQPWCGTFQDWAFWKCGAIAALPFRNFGTVLAAKHYQQVGRWFKDPQPGDLAFLHDTGLTGHVGLVVDVYSKFFITWVVTLEGNTSPTRAGDQRNGGQVAQKVRMRSFWAGFGRPNYDVVTPGSSDIAGLDKFVNACRAQTLKSGDKGPAVTFWQSLIGQVQDGDFGPATEEATKVFQYLFRTNQAKAGIVDPYLLPVTGIVDEHTWAAKLDTPA